MIVREPSPPVDVDETALGDLRRLHQRVMQLKTQAGPEDMSRALALLDDAETTMNALVVRARELGDRIRCLRKGLAARTAYRQARKLVPGHPSGERK